MSQNISGLGSIEAEFLSIFSSQGKSIFSVDEARSYWGDTAYTTNVLGKLEKKGWLKRIERGAYMIVPLAAGPDRAWSESALVIAPHLSKPSAIAYWSALHYWGMTEQIPHTVFVQSTRRKYQQEKDILGIPFRFITVVESKFFGVVKRSLNGQPIYITDREKTIVDATDRPDLCGGIAQLTQALEAVWNEIEFKKLDEYLNAWPTGAPLKRLGYLIEVIGLPFADKEKHLDRWRRSLSAGIVLLEPGGGVNEGPIVTRWRLRVNVDDAYRLRRNRS